MRRRGEALRSRPVRKIYYNITIAAHAMRRQRVAQACREVVARQLQRRPLPRAQREGPLHRGLRPRVGRGVAGLADALQLGARQQRPAVVWDRSS
ncbi:MAG TPA: hypothetical protein VNT03_06400 [Baekduia sp.]|nr:hypothetical protein [Baekduia sp.]